MAIEMSNTLLRALGLQIKFGFILVLIFINMFDCFCLHFTLGADFRINIIYAIAPFFVCVHLYVFGLCAVDYYF